MKDMKWDVLHSEYIIRRPWLTARRDKVRLPDGRVNDEYYVLEYPDWVNVIAITPDGPRWGSKCTHCMACLHRCPRHIIEWGKSTRGRGRYDLGRALRLAGLDDKRHDLPSAE